MMISIIKNTFLSIGIASATQWVLSTLNSNYLFEFLKQNIVNIQIGLLAINTSTLSIILTKLRDLIDSGLPHNTFTSTKKEMFLSIKEQIFLIITSLVILSLAEAKNLPFLISVNVFQTILIACFVYELMILYDTAKSIFILLEYKI